MQEHKTKHKKIKKGKIKYERELCTRVQLLYLITIIRLITHNIKLQKKYVITGNVNISIKLSYEIRKHSTMEIELAYDSSCIIK